MPGSAAIGQAIAESDYRTQGSDLVFDFDDILGNVDRADYDCDCGGNLFELVASMGTYSSLSELAAASFFETMVQASTKPGNAGMICGSIGTCVSCVCRVCLCVYVCMCVFRVCCVCVVCVGVCPKRCVR